MRRRTATLGSISLLVAASAFTAGGEDDLPPLTSPLDITLPAETPAPQPKAQPKSKPKTAAELRRPVLMVPGLPRPKPRVVAPVAKAAEPVDSGEEMPQLEPIAESLDEGLPPLDGPADAAMLPAPSESSIDTMPRLEDSSDGPPPLTLEAESADAETTPGRPISKKAGTDTNDVRRAPRRRLFGLLPPSRNRNEARTTDGSKIEFDPRSDPAADAALKRRVERVIRETAGPHVRSAEVSVVDRSIIIRARADRFYNRRAVKRQLESLPGLAGYNTRVDIVE